MIDFIWKHNYSSGNKVIDDQNRVIIVLINKLIKIMNRGVSNSEFEKIYNTIMVKAKQHFAYEEELIKRTTINQFFHHKNQHIEFFNRLDRMKNDYLEGKDILLDSYKYFQNWVDGHVQISDQRIDPIKYLKTEIEN